MRKIDKEREAKFLEKLDRMTGQLLALNKNSRSQTKVIVELKQTLSDLVALIEKFRKEDVVLKKAKMLLAKVCFGCKTQELSSWDRDYDSHELDKEDFDGCSAPDLPSEDIVTEPHLPAPGNSTVLTAMECPTNV